MSYLHIENLYKSQEILLFKECYAMEKIHGTSAHVSWNEGKLHLFSGGASYLLFTKLFDHEFLQQKFTELNILKITIYGEAYGGKMQGMSKTYGDNLKFIAFEVKIGDSWLDVPRAEEIAKKFNFDFVPYEKCSTDIDILNAVRDKASEQAVKCGMVEPRPREGIVLRPLIEVTKNNGGRIIAKHKNEAFSETKTKREVDPEKMIVLRDAEAIAEEWVTENRLSHVLDAFPEASMEKTGDIIKAMIEDVEREAGDEISQSQEARKAIGRKTVVMFKNRLKNKLTA
jgi:hypothetical protein